MFAEEGNVCSSIDFRKLGLSIVSQYAYVESVNTISRSGETNYIISKHGILDFVDL